MGLFEALNIVRKRLWLIALLLVVGSAVAAFSLRQQLPQYRTTTTLFIQPGVAGGALPQQVSQAVAILSSTYAEFTDTRAFAGVLGERLDLQGSEEELFELVTKAITTEYLEGTQYFRLSATHPDPELARDLANVGADVLITENTLRQQAQQEQTQAARSQELSPEEVEERERLAGLRDGLWGELDVLSVEIASLQQEIADQGTDGPSGPSDDDQNARLSEQLSNLQRSRADILASLAQIQTSLDAASALGGEDGPPVDTVVVVDPAPLPGKALSTGRITRHILALAAALSVGVGLAFLLEYLDYTFKSPELLEQVYGLPTQGVVAAVPKRPYRRLPDSHLIAEVIPYSSFGEAFRALRTHLVMRGRGHKLRSLLITSTVPDEGKTFVAANLAVSFAQVGMKVILVDADLRRSSVHELFEATRAPGLSDLLLAWDDASALIQPRLQRIYEQAANHEALRETYSAALFDGADPLSDLGQLQSFLQDAKPSDTLPKREISEVLRIVEAQQEVAAFLQGTSVENLRILPTGSAVLNPAELLASPAMVRVVQQLREEAQIVIYDSPPVTVVTDAVVLAPQMDGVLQVVRSGWARVDLVLRAKVSLERVGAPLLGTVLNRVSRQDMGSQYGYGAYVAYGERREERAPQSAQATDGAVGKGRLNGKAEPVGDSHDLNRTHRVTEIK